MMISLNYETTVASKYKIVYICACIHRYMAYKTISISDDVYKLLKDARRDEESFSDVIRRLLKKDKTELSEYFGALKDNPLLDELEEDSRKIRAMARHRT
ncbi:MAG: antitoxin VapB family protein [Methanotrichaceae archaeon]